MRCPGHRAPLGCLCSHTRVWDTLLGHGYVLLKQLLFFMAARSADRCNATRVDYILQKITTPCLMSSIHRVASYTTPTRTVLPKEASLVEVFTKAFTARPEITDPLDRAAYIFLTAVYNHIGFSLLGEEFEPSLLPLPEQWRILANACKRYHHTAQLVLWLFPELEHNRDMAEMAARRGRWRLLALLPRAVVITREREALDGWIASVRANLTRPAPGLMDKLRSRIRGIAGKHQPIYTAAGQGGMGDPTEPSTQPASEDLTPKGLLQRLDPVSVSWFSGKSMEFAYHVRHGEWDDLVKLVRSKNFAKLVLRPLDAVFANTSLTIADLARLLDAPEKDIPLVPVQLWLAGYSMALHSPRLTTNAVVRCRCLPTSISTVFPRATFEVLFEMHEKYLRTHLYTLWAQWWRGRNTLAEEADEQQRVKDPKNHNIPPEVRRLVEMERAPSIGIPRTALFSLSQLRSLCIFNDADDLMRYMRHWDDFLVVTKVLGLHLIPPLGAEPLGDHSWSGLKLTPTKVLMHPFLGSPVVLGDNPSEADIKAVFKKMKQDLCKIGFNVDHVKQFIESK